MPVELAEACAHAVMKSGIDLAVSYCMQVDHGFAQPLEFLLGGLDKVPVLPVFINGVATPLPGFQRTRMLGEAIGRFTSTLNKRVLFSNEELSAIAGKSTHEIKTWVAAFAAISAFGNWRSEGRYYRPIPEWIAGFGSLSARTEN